MRIYTHTSFVVWPSLLAGRLCGLVATPGLICNTELLTWSSSCVLGHKADAEERHRVLSAASFAICPVA